MVECVVVAVRSGTMLAALSLFTPTPDGRWYQSAIAGDPVGGALRIGNTGWGHETVFSADLRVVAVAGGLDNTLRRWEVKSGKELPLILGPIFIASLALSCGSRFTRCRERAS